MQYYQFHIGDYTTATVHLSLMEDLAYRRLLDLYYMTEEPIPNDIPRLSRRIRIDAEYIEVILDEFFELTENGWENHRCNATIKAFHEFIEKQRGNGKKGGRPRKKAKKTQALPTDNPPITQGKPTAKPPTTHNPLPITQDSLKERSAPVLEVVLEWLGNMGIKPHNTMISDWRSAVNKVQKEFGITPSDQADVLRHAMESERQMPKARFWSESIIGIKSTMKPEFDALAGIVHVSQLENYNK